MQSLITKYRPRTLADVLGQDAVVRALRQYAADPYPGAMLFHGDSGVGKTSAALALAYDLGVGVDEQELGGFHEIASGEMTGEAVRSKLNGLRLGVLFGSGWKVLIANEADRMSSAAETIWLDGLEHLPDRSLVIFTTNAPHRLTKRLRDRCENYAFTADPDALARPIRALAKRIWKAEVGKGQPPHLDTLGMPTLGDLDSMHASFRLAMHQLGRYIRAAKAGDDAAAVRNQLGKDLCYLGKGERVTADCDHCRKENEVSATADSHKCVHCKKRFTLNWK